MGQTVLIIFNLFILESLLSIDNAAVLAIMVKDLPLRDRGHALKYGIMGAFVMRGASLFAVSLIIKILWLKVAGGLYLLYLVYGHFSQKVETIEESTNTKDSGIYKFGGRLGLNRLWATILLVEIMDMAFSIDNIFASVAMTSNIVLILIGVFIGIIAMRFVAQWFTGLITRFPSLEKSAFIVIALLGLKLILTGILDYLPQDAMKGFINSHTFDFSFSGAMMFIFFVPLLTSNKTPTHAI
jgi:YkoY family integral membrane protein